MQAVAKAYGPNYDWRTIARAAACHWMAGGTSRAASQTYFHAVQRGFAGHMGEWHARVRATMEPKSKPERGAIDAWLEDGTEPARK